MCCSMNASACSNVAQLWSTARTGDLREYKKTQVRTRLLYRISEQKRDLKDISSRLLDPSLAQASAKAAGELDEVA
jgi:hypothetical protein